MRQWRRRLTTVMVVAALIAPALLDHDDFPLATYPMYARSRGDVVAVATAEGATATGEVVRLSLGAIGDSDDPLIVEALVRDAIHRGPAATDALCHDIAGRVAEDTTDVERISIVTETHNVVDHASGRPSLVSRQVHTTCRVAP